MKRTFYIFLMIVFFVLLSFFLYYSLLFSAIYYKIVTLEYVIPVTYIAESVLSLMVVGAIGVTLGYIFGKRWWKIIYIDKVYRFKA